MPALEVGLKRFVLTNGCEIFSYHALLLFLNFSRLSLVR